MQRTKIKERFEKLKEKGREKKQKIKKLVIKRKDDFLTALEKNWRDWALKPLTTLFYKLGVTANQITYAGFVLIALTIWLYLKDYSFKWQLIVLILAGLSDGLDGPIARNNNNVTVLGTWLDHIRDGALTLWATYLIYKYQLLSLELIFVIWALQILLVWVTVKDFLIRYLKSMPREQKDELMRNFSLDNLQASVIGRLQFFCITIGYLLLFLAVIWPSPRLLLAGHIFIFLEIVFVTLDIFEGYQKSLPKIK